MTQTYVIGHQQPDTDAICSAIAYAHYKQEHGETVVAARCGDINPETQFVLDRFDVDAPQVLDNAAGKNIILVDHNVYSQTADGMQDAEIVEVVDHHRLGDVESSQPIRTRLEPVGSTSTIVASMYRDAGIEIPEHIAGLMLSGLLSDTVVLRSPTTTDLDEEIASHLADIVHVDYEDYGKELLQQKSKLGEKTPREMVTGDFKEYDLGSGTIGIGQVETVTPEQVMNQESAVKDAMHDIQDERGYTFLVLLVTDLLAEDTEAFFVGDKQDVFEDALDTVVVDNTAQLPGVMSRKKQVVPPLEDALER